MKLSKLQQIYDGVRGDRGLKKLGSSLKFVKSTTKLRKNSYICNLKTPHKRLK